MTEVRKDFPDFSGNISGVDKKILLGVGVLSVMGMAGLIYKLVADKPRQTDEPLAVEQETHEDL